MDAIKLTARQCKPGPGGVPELCFDLLKSDCWKAQRLLELAPSLPLLELTVTEPKRVRSLPQNAFFWALVGQIASSVRASNNEIYKALLEAYTPPVWMAFPATAEKMLLNEPFRVISKQAEDGDKVTALCWKSSKYLDTKEFGALLDGTLEEAKQVGIDPEAVKLGLEAHAY